MLICCTRVSKPSDFEKPYALLAQLPISHIAKVHVNAQCEISLALINNAPATLWRLSLLREEDHVGWETDINLAMTLSASKPDLTRRRASTLQLTKSERPKSSHRYVKSELSKEYKDKGKEPADDFRTVKDSKDGSASS